MDDIRSQLERAKRDNRELEAELRGSLNFLFLPVFSYAHCPTFIPLAIASLDQRARLLEATVSENQEVIGSLRNETSGKVLQVSATTCHWNIIFM